MLSSDSRVERAVSVSSIRSTKVPLFLRACRTRFVMMEPSACECVSCVDLSLRPTTPCDAIPHPV